MGGLSQHIADRWLASDVPTAKSSPSLFTGDLQSLAAVHPKQTRQLIDVRDVHDAVRPGGSGPISCRGGAGGTDTAKLPARASMSVMSETPSLLISAGHASSDGSSRQASSGSVPMKFASTPSIQPSPSQSSFPGHGSPESHIGSASALGQVNGAENSELCPGAFVTLAVTLVPTTAPPKLQLPTPSVVVGP